MDDEKLMVSLEGPVNVAAGQTATYTVALSGGTGSEDVEVSLRRWSLPVRWTQASTTRQPGAKTDDPQRVKRREPSRSGRAPLRTPAREQMDVERVSGRENDSGRR